MSEVVSLVCWGGYTGKSVTGSNSGGYLLLTTSAAHGVRTGMGLAAQFTATTLPGNIAASTTYYLGYGTSTTTMYVYDTEANAIAGGTTGRVAYSSAGTGVVAKSAIVADPANALAAYGLGDLTRWYPVSGSAGGIYDGLAAWNTGRSVASALDEEICELGEDFQDRLSAQLTCNVPAAALRIEAKVNGILSGAFHGGNPETGYDVHAYNSSPYRVFVLASNYAAVDGFRVTAYSGFYNAAILRTEGFGNSVKNMIVVGPGGTGAVGAYGTGIDIVNTAAHVKGCAVWGCVRGISINSYAGAGLVVAGNTVTKCGTGMYPVTSTNIGGNFYNNISVGNTTNWGTAAGFTNASKNAGLSGEAWVSGSYSRITIGTTDFLNYPTDLSPALSTSPQVDTGIEYYGILPYDIAGNEVPNYNNGGSEAVDVGAYEYDHGYGNRPATATISLTNIVSGSRVLITKTSDGSVLYNDVPGTSLSFETSHIGGFDVLLRKASASPYYREFVASGTAVADQTTTIKCLQQLDE